MRTTIEFIDAVRARHGLTSDYKLAKFLGMSQARVSRYRNGHDFLGEDAAIQIADALGLPPEHVLATVAAERSKSERAKLAWRAAAAAAMLALAVALPLPQAEVQNGLLHTVYTLYAPSIDPPETFLAEWAMLFVLAYAALTYSRATTAPRRDPPRPIRPPRRARKNKP